MNRYIVIFAFLLLHLPITMRAQNLQAFKDRLTNQDTSAPATVRVTEDADAAAAIANLARSGSVTNVNGYRVRIFFDNGQDARERASSAMARFTNLYPNIPAYITYENPYFKVAVGNCLTNEEAIMLWWAIKEQFSSAFVVREEIPVSAFVF